MAVYIIIEDHQGGLVDIIGVFSTYGKAVEIMEKDYNLQSCGVRRIAKMTLDKPMYPVWVE